MSMAKLIYCIGTKTKMDICAYKLWGMVVFGLQILQTTIISSFLLFLGCTCRCSDHTILDKHQYSLDRKRFSISIAQWS
jgi:hypothetical protein